MTKSAPASASRRPVVVTVRIAAPVSSEYRTQRREIARRRSSSISIRRTVLPCSRSVRQRSRISPSEKTALPAPMIAIVGVTVPPAASKCQTLRSYLLYRRSLLLNPRDCLPAVLFDGAEHQPAPDETLQDDVGDDRWHRGQEEPGDD